MVDSITMRATVPSRENHASVPKASDAAQASPDQDPLKQDDASNGMPPFDDNAQRKGVGLLSYDVQLDPDTLRLHTDVINSRTEKVVMRLPVGYMPSEEKYGSKGAIA